MRGGAFPANICSCRSEATILTRTLDAFFAAVEQRDDPRLRGRPVIVGCGSCSRPATRRRTRRPNRDGRRAGSPAVPGGGRGRRRAWPRTRRRARRSTASSRTRRRSSRGSRSTRRSSTSAGRRLTGARRRDRGAARREVRERVGLPITVGVARTKFLAKVASGVAKPDGLLVVPPERRARVPAPAPGRAALGRRAGDREEAARASGSRPSARSPSSAEDVLVTLLGRAAGRQLHALAHNRDPRPVQAAPPPRLDRRAARARPRADVARRGRHVADRARRARHAPDAGRRPARPHRRAPPALRRLRRARRARRRCRTRPRTRGRFSSPPASCSRSPLPLIERQGITLVGVSVSNLDDDLGQLDAAARPGRGATRSTPRSTRCGCASGRPRSRGPCSSAGDRG